MVVGYGLANLGYLLFAAGIWKGSVRILGLKNRWHVLGSAVVFWVPCYRTSVPNFTFERTVRSHASERIRGTLCARVLESQDGRGGRS